MRHRGGGATSGFDDGDNPRDATNQIHDDNEIGKIWTKSKPASLLLTAVLSIESDDDVAKANGTIDVAKASAFLLSMPCRVIKRSQGFLGNCFSSMVSCCCLCIRSFAKPFLAMVDLCVQVRLFTLVYSKWLQDYDHPKHSIKHG
ncbi:hypothetical protein Dimus_029159 [Dionaea muscipula]